MSDRELTQWAITSWSCNGKHPAGGGYGFTIHVSDRFLEMAKAAAPTVDRARFQSTADFLCKQGGFQDYGGSIARLQWGQYGLMHLDVPGDATGLDIDYGQLNGRAGHGVDFAPHNIDTSQQQTALMAIWLKWAQGVEALEGDDHGR